jgi:hypothetical protein
MRVGACAAMRAGSVSMRAGSVASKQSATLPADEGAGEAIMAAL